MTNFSTWYTQTSIRYAHCDLGTPTKEIESCKDGIKIKLGLYLFRVLRK
jgi:hypothetical protein